MNNRFLHDLGLWFEELRDSLSFDETARREIMALEERVKFLEEDHKRLQEKVTNMDLAMSKQKFWS